MRTIHLQATIHECSLDELPIADQQLIAQAIAATDNSYAPYSHFHVGAAVRLHNGEVVIGCNQENAAFSVCRCAEHNALNAAAALHPHTPVATVAIAARDSSHQLQQKPVVPCGSCRQALLETEKRFGQPTRLLLYGAHCVYVADSAKALLPLAFTDFA